MTLDLHTVLLQQSCSKNAPNNALLYQQISAYCTNTILTILLLFKQKKKKKENKIKTDLSGR